MSIEHPCAADPGTEVMPERASPRGLPPGLAGGAVPSAFSAPVGSSLGAALGSTPVAPGASVAPALVTPGAPAPAAPAARGGRGAALAASGPAAPASVVLPDDARVWATLLGGDSATPLPPDELAALQAISLLRTVGAGQTVVGRDGSAAALVAVRSGEVALGLRTQDGTFRTERILRGPAWLDLSSAWVDDTHAVDAQAQSHTVVLELPRAALQARMAQHPGLAQRLIDSLARQVQSLVAHTHELMHKDAPARLAQWLHQRCEALPGRPGQAVVRLHDRKRDVASQLAITPETLSRLMRNFTRQGVIEVAGYTLRVLDVAALARLAQS